MNNSSLAIKHNQHRFKQEEILRHLIPGQNQVLFPALQVLSVC